jgi:cellulose synthase/poly-beta-1,6-N-acetylglucosamine synthase-like glycosyltransferase
MKWVFWSSVVLIAYTYAGYPLWLYIRSRGHARTVAAGGGVYPSVSIVMAVHNEADVLAQKLRNLTELDYPVDRYEIVVVSDGSTDATDQILAAHADERTRTCIVSEHCGKAAALNLGIQSARGDILVFTDARQFIETGALRYLVANFADPSVGCVSGELILGETKPAQGSSGLGLYWTLEKKIRQWESATGSAIGVSGALYAVRRELAVPFPIGIILDDVYAPLHVVKRGKRVIFEPRARFHDRLSASSHEFRRKVRTLTGNYQLLRLAPWLLTRSNPVLFDYISHKLLRLVAPFALAAVLIGSLFLRGAIYEVARVVQIAFYASGALTLLRFRLGALSRLADASLAFVVLNTAAVVAFVYFVTGKKEVWVR